MSEDRFAAAQYRTDVRREMKEQSATLHELVGELKAFKTDMSNMRSDLDKTKKDVADQRDARLCAQAAAWLGKWLWGGCGGGHDSGQHRGDDVVRPALSLRSVCLLSWINQFVGPQKSHFCFACTRTFQAGRT
jgi:hypothetical protein